MAALKTDDKYRLSPFLMIPLYSERSRALLTGSLILERQQRQKSTNHRLVAEFGQEN